MKRLKKDKIKKILAFMVALALMVSCMPSAYTISASEAFGDGTDDLFTDGESESVPAAEESTPDVSSVDQGEQVQQTTLTYENDSVKVTAEAVEESSIPQNTTLKADTVNENSLVSYDTVSQKLSKAAEDKGSSLRGFFAFDVHFADADGNRVEPNGRIKVTIEYKTPAAPELTDAASTSVTVEKLQYNNSTGETECYTLQPNEDLKVLNVSEAKQLQTVQVETSSAAVFAVMWDSPEAVSEDNTEDGIEAEAEQPADAGDFTDEEITSDQEPAEEPTVTEAPAEEPTVTEAPTEEPAADPTVTEAPAEDITTPDDGNSDPSTDEEPAAEPIIVEVIADDVNLHVSPSTDSETVATVTAGTRFTVLETITAEDGTTWYKVSYEEAEAYVRSDMVQVVDENSDEEPAEDTDQSDIVTYTQTVDNVVVTATANKGVLPEDAQFVVTPIDRESDQYVDIAAKLEEKAENEDYSIAGFFAYDIYFLDSEGNKIHPEDGSVKVSMDYQESSAPEEVKDSNNVTTLEMASEDENSQSDENTAAENNLSISVMHFVEDEDGKVQSVVDMTKDGAANVEANADGEVQKAEFETESFSTFTITWTIGNQNRKATLTVHLIDENKNEIDGSVISSESVQSNGANIELSTLGSKYAPSGYGYLKAYSSDMSEEIAYISYNSYGNGGYAGWFYSKNGSNWNWVSTSTTFDVYLMYKQLSFWITDNIMETGNLIPEADASLKAKIEAAGAENVKYTWYKSVNDGEFTEVEEVKHGDYYNLSEDGKQLNVALDGGALNSETGQTSVKYKVKLTITTNGTTEEVESNVFNNTYWNELQNGSFETPAYTRGYSGQFTNDAYRNAGGVWQSTGEGTNGAGNKVNIEIVNTRTTDFRTPYSWHGDNGAYDGNQFAELNCEAAGALYQDVMTYAGESMNYWLSHRARGKYNQTIENEKDTMYLVIMPTSVAMTAAGGSELKTQAQLETYLRSVLPDLDINKAYSEVGDEVLYNQNGILISRITSNDLAWHTILKSIYTTSSYLTRFFFVSGNTASGNNTVGNFLDKVGFSQKLPAANPGSFTLQVKKNISGLTADQITALEKNLKFVIKATDTDGKEVSGAALNGKELTLTDANVEKNYNAVTDTYTYTWTFENEKIPHDAQYIYRVTEENAEISGYTLTKDFKVTGGTVQEDNQSTLIEERTSAIFEFTNKYVNNKKKNVSFTKVWDDFNNAYNTRPDSLTVTLKGTVEDKVVKQYTATLKKDGATVGRNNDGVTVESSGNWTCTWKNLPVYDNKGNIIHWSVEEGEVSGTYVYDKAAEGSGNGSGYSKENTSTVGNFSMEEIQDGAIPGSSNSNNTTAQSDAESNDIAVMSANDSDEYGISTQAWNNWGGGSSSTFDHIDIEAVGSYTFEYGGTNYTVAFDFHAGTWTLYKGTSASGTAVGSGKVDVSTFKITNKTQGSGVAISGNWQHSTTSGQTWEYRISGTFNRTDTFHVHYEIPVAIDGVTINLIADFDTSYTDKTYNVCPGNGNSKGIDIEMDTALAKELTGSIVLTKVISGTDNAVPEGISFTVTGPDYNATISYDDFRNGSYVISGLQVGGTYTVTETSSGTLDGYINSGTVVAVNGNRGSSGTSATVTTTSGMSTVTFTNTYTEVQKEHTLFFKKVWVGGNGAESTSEINLNVTYSDGTTKTISLSKANSWQATETVAADVFIKSAEEVGSVTDYKSSVTISGDKTTAIATNTYSSSTTKSLTVTKAWAGDEGHTDLRKPIQIQLYQNDRSFGDPVELNADNYWTYTFTNLRATTTEGSDTVIYTYTVSEITTVPAYNSTISYNDDQTVATITNTLNAEELDESFYIANKLETDTVTVNKYWDDDHNKYGSRPSNLDINLTTSTGRQVISFNFGSGESNTANQWRATLTVPKLKTGNTYKAEEVLASDTNYECTASQPTGNDIYFVNKPVRQTLIVEKIWNDGNNANNTRPNSVNFKLQYRLKGSDDTWQDYQNGDFTITSANADTDDNNYWYYKITDLDVKYEYQIVETGVPENYTETRNSATSITNTLNWKAVKKSSSTDASLGGAEFKLTDQNGNDVATGTSAESTGVITWNVNSGVTLNGDYTLTETKAPRGYKLSETTWTLKFVNGILTNAGGDGKVNWDKKTVTLTITNDVLYTLPNAGGPGIYGFTISGVAILATALLLFINNKRREEEAKKA